MSLDCIITDWAIRCVSTWVEAGAVDIVKTIVIGVDIAEAVQISLHIGKVTPLACT